MKRMILLFLLVLLVPSEKLFLQEIPDCMCVPLSYPKTGQVTNPDSACVIDTCGIWFPSVSCDQAYWNNILSGYGEEAKKRVYSKGFWDIEFSVPAIPIPASPTEDTIIYADWTDIDTTYPEIRNTFRDMEDNFGDLYFRKLSPTAGEKSKRFLLYFNNYVNVDSITKIGRATQGIYIFDFSSMPYRSPEDNVFENDKNELFIQIYPNPASEYIEINSTGFVEEIRINNALGECVKKNLTPTLSKGEGVGRVDVSDLPSGVYFVRISDFVGSFVVLK